MSQQEGTFSTPISQATATGEELEEGEVMEDGDMSYDDDYSPGSLVIDDVERVPSGPPSGIATPPTEKAQLTTLERLQSKLQFDSHPIFGITAPPTSTLATTSMLPGPLLPNNTTPTSVQTTPTSVQTTPTNLGMEGVSPAIAALQEALLSLPNLLPVTTEGRGQGEKRRKVEAEEEGGKEKLRFLVRTDVPPEATSPVDTLCIYQFKYGKEYIEVITRRNLVPLIPIKNVYNKAIPDLKQNVLSARISKLGIRSLVLSEPYVSTVKKMDIGLTGSSHYVTVLDFIKICIYFKAVPAAYISKLDLILSSHPVDDILRLFNDPESPFSQELLTRLTREREERRGVGDAGNIPGIGGGAMVRGSGILGKGDGGRRDMTPGINFAEADPRKVTLPNGTIIHFLVKEGSPYIPNPELAKILPAVNRTAMENFRNTYGISVSQASKTDMDVMKCIGVVSVKAGRTLLYKVADVVAMFHHWKCGVPAFIEEMAQGKLLGEKVTISNPYPMDSRAPSPHAHGSSPAPISNSSLLSAQVAASNHTHGSPGSSTPSSAFQGSTPQLPQKRAWHGGVVSDVSPLGHHSSLTPDQFQVPVRMLNSLAAEGAATTTSPSGHVTPDMGSQGQDDEPQRKKIKRRNSSISGSPLDDQDLEYSELEWGSQTLTLLCPSGGGEEPYLSIPELLQKVLQQRRSLVNVQQRNMLGILLHPASSFQILTLRERRSLDNFTGNVKLVSLSDAVKLAVSGNIEIPGSVIQRVTALSKVPLQEILNPPITPVQAPTNNVAQATPPPARTPNQHSVKQEVMSSSSSSSLAPPMDVGVATGGGVAPHPDIVQAPHDWRIEGTMYQVKWGEQAVVVYTNHKGEHFMGLYQVYDALFKCYVTRMNFKMRMRKLNIRSNRAPSSIRMKLVDLNALPTNCPVCGLITVREMEILAKSYGVTPPPVFYERFLIGDGRQSQQKPRPKVLQPVQPHTPQPTGFQASSSSQLPQNLFSYQFDPSDDTAAGPSSQVPRIPKSVGQYGVVPYLTSSAERSRDLPTSSPNLITTSLGTKRVQTEDSGTSSLVVRIPRKFTKQYKPSPRPILPAPYPEGAPSGPVGAMYNNSRGKVLHTLAKKISQKSRKFSNSLGGTLHAGNRPGDPSREYPRVCPSCGHLNAQHKKRCGACNEFIVGTRCPACTALNYYRSKTCSKCGVNMPGEQPNLPQQPSQQQRSHDQQQRVHLQQQQQQQQQQQRLHDLQQRSHAQQGGSHDQQQQGVSHVQQQQRSHEEVPGSAGSSGSSSHPTSPSSPKYSAPPIRSAVLKSLFPQAKAGESSRGPRGVARSNIAGNKKCIECGHMNTKMAKKCIKCKSHLQGRACINCGRPNLNHVTECYKCGSTLPPPASSKWIYVGGSNGNKMLRTTTTSIVAGATELPGRAPVSCIRCTRFRSAGYFKCGRCGDVFQTRPLVNPPCGATPTFAQKKRKESSDGDVSKEPEKIDTTVLEEFARNLLSAGVKVQLTPVLVTKHQECKVKVAAAAKELGAAEAKYQVASGRHKVAEEEFNMANAELDSLVNQMEAATRKLQEITKREEAAKEETEDLPTKIEELKKKLQDFADIFDS